MALKEFILEQLYVVTKSVEELKKLQQALKNSPLFEFLKEEEFDQGETIINKRNPRLVKMKKKKKHFRGQNGQDVERWKLSKNEDRKHKVYVKSFSSAKVKCMKDYVKFPLEKIIPTM